MNSLRWRIAVWYALLLVVVTIALGVAITLRFEGILRAQATEHVVSTLTDIASPLRLHRTRFSSPRAATRC